MILTLDGEWKPLYQDDDGQWGYYDDNLRSGSNVSATSYTQYNSFLQSILSAPQYKAFSVTFTDDVAVTKGVNDDELFFHVSKLNTRKFDKYDGFSTSTAVGPFVPNYVYATTHRLISSFLSIALIILTAYTIASIFCYCINSLSNRNRQVDVNKISKVFLFNPDNVMMKTLEATTQIGDLNQRLQIRQSNKRLPYNRPHRHEDDTIDTLFSSMQSHNGTTAVELIFGSKTLFTYVYAI